MNRIECALKLAVRAWRKRRTCPVSGLAIVETKFGRFTGT
jgi:hypothetical protein